MDENQQNSMAQSATPQQPKTLHKLAVRTAIGLFLVAVFLVGYTLLKRAGQDIDLPARAETSGLMAAIQYHEQGSQAVLIRPDGTIVPSPDYRPGAQDRELVWRPDGNRLFFVSDREENTFHLYRWNPASNAVQRRSFGSRGYQYPSFARVDDPVEARRALVAVGGRLLELDPNDGSTIQVLPPMLEREQARSGEEGEGAVSAFDALYRNLGTSFKKARYLLGKQWIAAVMQRDQGQVLIVQNLSLENGNLQPPVPVAAGERVDFDVEPTTGTLVFTSIGFDFPGQVPEQFVRDGRVIKPFQHLVAAVNLQNINQVARITESAKLETGFSTPVLSPDGSQLMLVVGKHSGEGEITPTQLVVVPVQENGGASARLIKQGVANDPVWSPDGSTIAYWTVGEDGKREIRVVDASGANDRTVTAGKGSFARPVFSPQ